MPTLTMAVAAVAAVVMAVAVALMLRRTAPASLLPSLAIALLSVVVTAALANAVTGIPPQVAGTIATGTAPVAVLILGLLSREDRARLAPTIAVALWAAIVVPLSIVVPQVIAAGCPPQACIVEDFAGGLPYAIGVGAFVLVPSAAVPTLRRTAVPSHPRPAVGLMLVVWAAFTVWIAALELDVDEYTGRIALAAVIAPATASVGWVVTDRIRGLDASVARGLSRGLAAGMVATLPSIVAVTTPWSVLIGAVAGIAGALAHDARALRSSPPTMRMAVTALVVGIIAMVVPGILGTTLGFVFAARVDVLGAQLLAVLGVAVVAIAVSIPAAILLRRGAGR